MTQTEAMRELQSRLDEQVAAEVRLCACALGGVSGSAVVHKTGVACRSSVAISIELWPLWQLAECSSTASVCHRPRGLEPANLLPSRRSFKASKCVASCHEMNTRRNTSQGTSLAKQDTSPQSHYLQLHKYNCENIYTHLQMYRDMS